MKRLSLLAFLIIALAAIHILADETRFDMSTFENSMKDHAKIYENAWDYWGLTKEEWNRFESIKQKSPWSVWKNEATPLAILSHYASSTAEKSRYARLEAELDQWRENTVLEFQHIYNKQREVVFAKNAAVMNGRKPDVKNIKAADRVLYFVEAGECNTRCRTTTYRLLGSSAHVDIFVIGAKDQNDIFAWATSAKVPIDRVQVKQITLNFENSYLAAVTTTPKSVLQFPVAYLQAKDGYQAVIF
jgi:integrating conjugative element protein (TIGR03759 family)